MTLFFLKGQNEMLVHYLGSPEPLFAVNISD
jgi:hypothetical protein